MSLLAFTPSASITMTVGILHAHGVIPGNGHYLRIVNAGEGRAWVAFYETWEQPAEASRTTSMLLLPGAIEVFSVASDTTRVAAIGDGEGASLNITRGEGQ